MNRKILTLAVCFLLLLSLLACTLEGMAAPVDEQVRATGQWLDTRIVAIATTRALMTQEARE